MLVLMRMRLLLLFVRTRKASTNMSTLDCFSTYLLFLHKSTDKVYMHVIESNAREHDMILLIKYLYSLDWK